MRPSPTSSPSTLQRRRINATARPAAGSMSAARLTSERANDARSTDGPTYATELAAQWLQLAEPHWTPQPQTQTLSPKAPSPKPSPTSSPSPAAPPSSCLPRAPPSGERYYPPSTRPTMDTTKMTTTRELTAPETTVAHGLAPLLLVATPRTETPQRHTSKMKQPTQPPPPPTTTAPRA